MKTVTVNGRRVQILGEFRTLEYAFEMAERMPTWGCVLMGEFDDIEDPDSGWYWVTTRADGQRLERAGYEVITRSMLARD